MKAIWKTGMVIVALGAFGALMYIKETAKEISRDLLRSHIADAISQHQAGEISMVDISSLTTFSWERLYIFGPYTTPEKIDAALGYFWLHSRFTSIVSSESITLLVFTNGGHVVQYVVFPRDQGDFSSVDNDQGYPAAQSRFTVDERGRIIWTGEE